LHSQKIFTKRRENYKIVVFYLKVSGTNINHNSHQKSVVFIYCKNNNNNNNSHNNNTYTSTNYNNNFRGIMQVYKSRIIFFLISVEYIQSIKFKCNKQKNILKKLIG